MRSSIRFFTAFWGVCLIFFTPVLRSSVDTSFLSFLQQAIPATLDDEEMGIIDSALNQSAHQVWNEAITKGASERQDFSDKVSRTIFGHLQTNIEELLLMQMQPEQQAVWIIHTPLIATPLVTTGKLNQDLVAKETLQDNDTTCVRNAVARAKLMRDFLDKGGFLVVAFHKDLKNNRSKEQLAIYEKLKKQYPKQLIEFPIERQFQPNNIGATYLVVMPNHDIFEMTNQGVQINQSQDKAKWGLWLQMRNQSHEGVSARLCTQFQFLFENGLRDTIKAHAAAQGMAPEKVLSILNRYDPHDSQKSCPSN